MQGRSSRSKKMETTLYQSNIRKKYKLSSISPIQHTLIIIIIIIIINAGIVRYAQLSAYMAVVLQRNMLQIRKI